MLNLYWKCGEETRSLVEEPFRTEGDLEKYLFDNQELLGGDISVIYRQIRTGSRQGIPDMLGVDQDAGVCLIELKNVEVTEDVLPQALGYAIWAETNPDSIRAIWLESEDKPEVQIDWDNMDIRLIIVAPSFNDGIRRMAGKIGYAVDLVQVRRYCHENERFLLVEFLAKPAIINKITKPMGTWDWAFYEKEHGQLSTSQFRSAVDALDALVKRQSWGLSYNINKYYTGFKLGSKVVFSVNWGGTYVWKLQIKLPEAHVAGFTGQRWEFQTYDNTFKDAIFRPLTPDAVDLGEMEPLLTRAVERVRGGD